MTKEMLKAKASDVYMMDEEELYNFGIAVDMSDADPKSKAYLYLALEDRQLQLMKAKESQGASVVISELREEELS